MIIHCIFIFPPDFLLLPTFQSPQLIALFFFFFCILFRVFNCNKWERECNVSPPFGWNQKSSSTHRILFFFIVGAPLNVTGSCPLIELVFGDPIYLSLVVPAPKSLWLQVFCLIWLDIHCTCSLGKDVFICPYVLYPGLYAPMCYILGKQKCLKLDPCPQRAHGIVE